MQKVAVILSTYNGEKYLEEQIDSILGQTYKNLDLIIRDDGSKDKTISIIKKYLKNNKNIKLVEGENLGFIKSFYKLLEDNEDYDYYAFADQDDIWENEKIEYLINEMKNENNEKPNLVFSDFDYYDENLNFLKQGPRNRMFCFENSLVECVSPGMTMMINKTARNILIANQSSNSLFHDWWCYMICSAFGNVKYVKKSLVKYRRLNKSVTAEGNGFFALFKWRIKQLVFQGGMKKIKLQILDYKKMFYEDIDEKYKKILDLFSDEYNFKKSVKKAFYLKRFRRKIIDEILVRILFLIGIM